MTYSSGGVIQATDYNTFVSTGSPNINRVWGPALDNTGTGWGQTALATVSAGSTVNATNWASMVNTLTSMGGQTNTSITARTAPTAGQPISVLSAVSTDISNIYTNRNNAQFVGATSTTWFGSASKTTATGSGTATWTITFISTVQFASLDQARYFFNCGGRFFLTMNKSSTGTDMDADWNTFVGKVGTISFTGLGTSKTLAGTAYTGTTRTGGSGGTETTLATATGWYNLAFGTGAYTTLFQLNDDAAGYTGSYIKVEASRDPLFDKNFQFRTTWVQPERSGAGQSTNISGGTETTSPFTAYGTAPTVICRAVYPSTTYLTNSWGTPSIISTTT